MCSREINKSPGLYHRWRFNKWCSLCYNQRDSLPINSLVDNVHTREWVCVCKCMCYNRTKPQTSQFSSTAMLIIRNLNYFTMYFLPRVIINTWEILIFHMILNPHDFQRTPWVLHFPGDMLTLWPKSVLMNGRSSLAPAKEYSLLIR